MFELVDVESVLIDSVSEHTDIMMHAFQTFQWLLKTGYM